MLNVLLLSSGYDPVKGEPQEVVIVRDIKRLERSGPEMKHTRVVLKDESYKYVRESVEDIMAMLNPKE